MATDNGPVLPSGQYRGDEAELAKTPFERVKLVLADTSGVGWVGTELVDGDLLDGEY
jgi:hypothetical protein